jgi:hypothetical protein
VFFFVSLRNSCSWGVANKLLRLLPIAAQLVQRWAKLEQLAGPDAHEAALAVCSRSGCGVPPRSCHPQPPPAPAIPTRTKIGQKTAFSTVLLHAKHRKKAILISGIT